jgi:succinoglycan biosynthesis transport protein ExoP
MTDHHSVPSKVSPVRSEMLADDGDEFQDFRGSAEPSAVRLWMVLRRHLILIVACTGLAIGAAVAVTSRTTRLYQATASLRIDDKGSPLAALAPLAPTGGGMATELEMLRSRQLAEEVVDTASFQVRVLRPSGVPRSAIFSHLEVARSTAPGLRRLVRDARGRYVLVEVSDGRTAVARTVGLREPAAVGGFAFELAPTAEQYPLVEVDILPFERAVDSLQASILVARRSREAEIVDVSLRHSDPAFARDVVNTLVRQFIEGGQGARQLKARNTVSYLRDQLDMVGKQLAGAAQAVGAYRSREHIVNLPAEASSGVSRRAELQGQRNELETERQALDRLYRNAASDSGAAADPGAYRKLLAFPTLLKSGIASDVVGSLTAAEERRAELLSRRTERDPDVVRVQGRITQLQQQIGGLVSTYLHGLTDQVSAIDSVLAKSDAALGAIPRKDMRLGALQRTEDGSEAIYTMLQQRLQEAEIAAATVDQTISLVDAAVLPQAPVAPRPLLNLALALVTGGMLGIVGAFLREHSDPSLHTRRELLEVTGVPVLGLVPRLRTRRSLPVRLGRRPRRKAATQDKLAHSYGSFLATGSVTAPPPPATPPSATAGGGSRLSFPTGDASRSTSLFIFTEALARLATNLALVSAEERPRVLMVTSSLPGDGKTTIAANLALALARAGQRVLLLDADLRGGRIAQLVAVQHRIGMAELLGGQAEAEQIVQQVGTWSRGSLDVIAAGALNGVPAELLGSAYAHQLIEWARSEYDTVVVDTPPVTSVADATVLAPMVDGVVLVARAGSTAREALVFTVEQLRIVRAPVLGAVLNDVDLRRDASYDGAYEYYGRYGNQAVE